MTKTRTGRRPTARRSSARARPRRRRPSPRRRAQLRSQRRRMLRRISLWSAAIVVVVGAAVLIPLGLAHEPAVYCATEPAGFPDAGIAGWEGEQLDNAATIMLTASALGFGRDGQILGVMTAMGESSLRNIDYGDWETSGFRNPDGTRTTSIGLFQQQDWWGSAEQRMDPATAATLFYGKLSTLEGWQQMPASHAIHRVQVNTDADYYTRYQEDATAVVDALTSGCTAPDAGAAQAARLG
ncbi:MULTISPECIES: hypothetical protein [unclassified Microbacterium]|uniref:hypothetical protein n=1 Tax=unclassified Microbacterium TaxID=2609290 RepID=UPI0015E2AFE2|nr:MULTISPECIES: hypothetical protein [unclassified Microbacterium]